MSLTLHPPLLDLLREVEQEFEPPLSAKVDLDAYARKLLDRALLFTTVESGRLTALVAVYCNDGTRATAYITMVAVARQARGQGLAQSLIGSAIAHCRGAGFARLALEVYRNNSGALQLYDKLGFRQYGGSESALMLELVL